MNKFLTNAYDPSRLDAKQKIIRQPGQTREETWQSELKYLADKEIGEPRATDFYTVSQLKQMNMVGVYLNTETKSQTDSI